MVAVPAMLALRHSGVAAPSVGSASPVAAAAVDAPEENNVQYLFASVALFLLCGVVPIAVSRCKRDDDKPLRALTELVPGSRERRVVSAVESDDDEEDEEDDEDEEDEEEDDDDSDEEDEEEQRRHRRVKKERDANRRAHV